MSKASEWAAGMARFKAHRERQPMFFHESTVIATVGESGNLYFQTGTVIPPEVALRLRDWLTEHFEDGA